MDSTTRIAGSAASSRVWPPARRLARAALAVSLAAPIAVYLWVAAHRLGYAYELDWMEGGSVALAARIAAGHSIYAAPSLAFVGWTYPPLYYWVAAAVAKLVGIGFLALRLVSVAGSAAVMAALGLMAGRETRDRLAGLVAAGLFAATFVISGAWFDTGRVDSLFLALTLVALAWGSRAQTARGGVGLGVLAFLAFFTKQSGVVAVLPALLYLGVTRRRVGIPALLTLLVLGVVSTLALDAASDGWYRYYVFSELASQPWAQPVWVSFWTHDIWQQQWPLVVLVVAGGATSAWRARGRIGLRSPVVYQLTAASGLIASAWMSRLHTGGYANVLMPAYAAMALLAALAFGSLSRGSRGRILGTAAGIMVVVQVILLAYPLDAQIPTAADRAAGAALIARLRSLPGQVIVLRHPWYATLAETGTSTAQEEAIHDVLRSGAPRGASTLRASLGHALDADGVRAVVLDYPGDGTLLGPQFKREFRLQSAPVTPSALYPLTDLRTAPRLVYVRRGGLRTDPTNASSSPPRHRASQAHASS
jgi:4-amino-4-deoxy-L-arabinose transferase-like glycosyltransferase